MKTKVEKLEKLCRALQSERKTLSKQLENGKVKLPITIEALKKIHKLKVGGGGGGGGRDFRNCFC